MRINGRKEEEEEKKKKKKKKKWNKTANLLFDEDGEEIVWDGWEWCWDGNRLRFRLRGLCGAGKGGELELYVVDVFQILKLHVSLFTGRSCLISFQIK